MKRKKGKIIFFLGTFLAFFLKAGLAFADLEVHYPSILGHSLNSTSSLGEYVCYLFSAGTSLAVSIAAITIAWGGIYYLVSFGRGKFTTEAKDIIKSGILGLLIVVCASLILYTINPNLTKCQLAGLPHIDFNPPGSSTPPGLPGAGIVNYKEIPIGVLTENLLTRTMDCYGFDQKGNPVDGDQIGTNGNNKIYGPTYTNHDRADCITQLVDGAQKKSQVIAALSDEITKLMNTCSCSDALTGASKCDPKCGGQSGCQVTGGCPGGSCAGACVGGGCTQPAGTTDCCPTGVKDQIEHGPITMAVDIGESPGDCQTQEADYNGLDDFRCPNTISGDHASCDDVENFVEKKVQANGKTYTVIDQDNWKKLNLLQQLTYYKDKIKEIEKTIQDDEDVLDKARSALASCYLAMPYVDLLKTYQNTDQKQKIILAQDNFTDPQTQQKINASKYCQGFNYNNSGCLKKCNDQCPDTSNQAVECYNNCGICNQGDKICQAKQENCVKGCYNSRPCTQSDKTSQTFSDCISTCQDDCASQCDKKYLDCSDEHDFCMSQCKGDEGNSQCVLDNANSCLFNSGAFAYCANKTDTSDNGNIQYCINNSYWCKNGSDQYAGYADCVDPKASSAVDCASINDKETCTNLDGCKWGDSGCSQDYSASALYDSSINSIPFEKCPNPYSPAKSGTGCYAKNNSKATCLQTCPETQKCPTSSSCPNCKCDSIDQTLKFSVPNESDKSNAGDEGYTTESQPVSAYQIVGPQCNNYSYNDDPLTFYCEDNWWNDPNREGLNLTPLGQARICNKDKEVPVGQTIDDAKNWANKLISDTDNLMDTDAQNVIDQMIKIGEAKDTSPIQDYCGCGANFDNSKGGGPICQTGCQYNQWNVPIFNIFGYVVGYQCRNSCTFMPCKGSPCQQITDYLSKLWNDNRTFKTDFIDFYTAMIIEPRSDIMKELTYSRQSTDSCSLINNVYNADERLFDCTRVKDEIISPVNQGKVLYNEETYNVGCYGQDLGKEVKKDLTDNWFCCQNYGNN